MAKCFHCKENAIWAMQFLPGNDTGKPHYIPKPSFALLGNHYRGFRVWRVCDDCRDGFDKALLIFVRGEVRESPF